MRKLKIWWRCHGRKMWSVGETHSITFGERERWWTFYMTMMWEPKRIIMTVMVNGTTELNKKSRRICQETQIKWGKIKLPFLLTRFIRKENLDKRGCKITEIVERHKIKADSNSKSGMNCELCSLNNRCP